LNIAGRDSWVLFAEAKLPVRILHQAGRGNAAVLAAVFRATGLEGEVVEFIEDMPSAFAEADVVVCRSGASTVAELAAAGRASVLVPFPFAADDHQRHNAEAMERAGASRLVPDQEMTGQRLFDEVCRLFSSPELLRQMSENARRLARAGAAGRAADVLEAVSIQKSH
jgi:UDP-N-acetylglucosamine--N-acetylmuramyl-(pentapeptide) pyrophosphoryl-undecaprenol N-acetylglucosamine transferase